VLSLKQDRHDAGLLERLHNVLERSLGILLLPEIVENEIARLRRRPLDDLEKKIRSVKMSVDSLGYSSEWIETRSQFKASLDRVIALRTQNYDAAVKVLTGLFNSKNVHRLHLSPDIMTRAYCRSLAGRRPSRPDTDFMPLHADCLIVETVIDFLRSKNGERMVTSDELVICTGNYHDFAKSIKEKNALHPDILQDMSPLATRVVFYRSLPEMIQQEFQVTIDQTQTVKFIQAVDAIAMEEYINRIQALTGAGVVIPSDKGTLFSTFAAHMDVNTSLVLGWFDHNSEPITERKYFEVWASQVVDEAKRREILRSLEVVGFLIPQGNGYVLSDLGQQYIEYVGWLRATKEYRPAGQDGGL
jgi:hypothetical protein